MENDTAAQLGQVTYDPQDDKLRVYFDEHQTIETLEPLRDAGFRWAPQRGAWYAVWTPSRVDAALAVTGTDALDDEPSTLDERAAERAERFEGYADNAHAEQATRRQDDKRKSDLLNGQPVIVGHHSEQRHRSLLRRMWANFGKGVEAGRRASYWTRRAEGSAKWARHKQTHAVRARRIKKLEADARRYARELVKHERSLKLCGQGASWQLLKAYCGQGDGATPYGYWSRLDAVADASPIAQVAVADAVLEDLRKHATSQAEHWQRWHDHATGRIAYETAQLDDPTRLDELKADGKARKPKRKLPPILNIEEGVTGAWRMTSADFSRLRRAQYASLTICGEGENKYRRRRAMVSDGSGSAPLGFVFLTDKPAHPAPEGGTE